MDGILAFVIVINLKLWCMLLIAGSARDSIEGEILIDAWRTIRSLSTSDIYP
jgi:hypothetical protein